MATAVTVSATNNAEIDGLLGGTRWTGTITYSFPDSASDYPASYSSKNEPASFTQAPSQMQAAIVYAVSLINSYTNANIQFAGTNGADIMVGQSPQANPTSYAYYPSNAATGGDVWFGTAYNYSLASLGNYYFATALHEFGHAVGLKHSQETGGVANVAVPAAHDDSEYTVMSYRSYVGASVTAGYTAESYGFPQTYMANDILALQTLYGANFSTQSGNTVYSWSPTTGQEFINGVAQPAPGGGAGGSANRIFETIWDGNGIDTYDLSNYTTNLTLNLNPGASSTFSSVQIAYLGDGHYASGNVFNAYLYNNDARSYIDNAIGGSGNDTIIGNAIANVLTGGGGNDNITGGGGNDRLIGGPGVDTMSGGSGADTFVFLAGDSSAAAGQHDLITDFSAGDKIDVSAIDAIPATAGIDLFRFLGTAAFDGTAGALNYAYNSATNITTLYGDTNGDRVADFAIDLSGNIAITQNDLIGVFTNGIFVTPTPAQAVQGGAAVAVLSGAPTIVDTTSTTLSSATIKVSAAAGNIFPGDQLFINGVQSGTVDGGRVTISWNDNTKIMTLSGVAPLADYQTLLSQISYQWTGTDGSVGIHTPHTLTWTVNDGTASFGTTSVITIDRAPVATVTNVTLNPNATTVAAATLLTASDQDNDPIAVYAFKVTGNGHFFLNGVVQPNNQEIDVTAAQLAQLTYQSGGGSDSLQVRVSDGTAWSSWQSFTVTAPAAVQIEAAGPTSLVQVGNNYYLGVIGPELKYGGAAITTGIYPGWSVIGVEAASTAFQVAWHDSASGQFSFWNTDSNGNFTTNAGVVAPNSAALQAFETTFNQDFNNDGVIGFVPTAIESAGATSLVLSGNNYFLGSGGPTLKYGGAPITFGIYPGWSPVGAEATATGFEVAWKDPNGTFSIWNTDSSGNFTTNAGVADVSSAALQAFETSFHQDFNNDGVIGPPAMPPTTTIESSGSTSLLLGNNNYYLGSGGPILKYQGTAITPNIYPGWSVLGVEATSTGFQVAWHDSASGQFSIWNIDSGGNFTTNAGVVTANTTALYNFETNFHQDLNNDGTIGQPTGVIESAGSTSLLLSGNNYFLGSGGPTLKYGGAPITVGIYPGWSPVGVEAKPTGFQVAWVSGGTFSIWNTDTNGNFTTNAGIVASNSAALQSFETSFQQDFNNDGVIGPTGHMAPTPAAAGQDAFVFKADGDPAWRNGSDGPKALETLLSGTELPAAIHEALQPPHDLFALVGGDLNSHDAHAPPVALADVASGHFLFR